MWAVDGGDAWAVIADRDAVGVDCDFDDLPCWGGRRNPRPVTLDSSIDRAALIGLPEARRTGSGRTPAKIYLRTERTSSATFALVGAAANPENPEEVEVSRLRRPEAKAAAEGAFTSLLLGLGAVALLVGGVGIANVMVISVIERRSEIGLRRALGATRRQSRRSS